MRKWKKAFCLAGFLFLLLSTPCGVWSQKTSDQSVLLGERHKSAGIECAQCHEKKPPTPVPTAVCSSCHQGIAKSETIREHVPNPHKAHMSYPDCAECHHVHKASENKCSDCHNFEFKMR